jgi:hypothetical protein
LCTVVAQGQKVTASAKENAGMGYFMFGTNIIDLGPLNSRLESKGYPKFSDNFFSLGGGGHGIINRVIIGGEGHALATRKTTSGSYKMSIGAGYGFFNLGYIVYKTKDLRVYPLLGLGGGGMDLQIMEKGSPSFDEILDNPKRSAKLSTDGFLFSLALGTDYLLKLGRDEKGEGGLVFGLRIGYTFAPIKGDWSMDGIDISGGPQVGITGPYIHLMIGGGGSGKK